jgi:hypothetical protein
MQKIFLLALWSQKIKYFMQPWGVDLELVWGMLPQRMFAFSELQRSIDIIHVVKMRLP